MQPWLVGERPRFMRRSAGRLSGSRCVAAAVVLMVATLVTSSRASAETNAATVDVVPHVGLVDGQTVHVTVHRFDPGGKVWLSECATVADVNPEGCGQQLAGQPFLLTSDSGDASGTFVVSARASARPYSTTRLLPCSACVLVAVEGVVAGHPSLPVASTPLSFARLPMTGFPLAAACVAGGAAVVVGLLLVRTRRRGFFTFR